MKFNKLALCIGLLFAASTCFAQMYTVTDLGTLGGAFGEARALNNSGQVVGASSLSNGELHAFLYSDGRMIDLGIPGAGVCNGSGWAEATGINDSGQIVGFSNCGNSLEGWILTDGITTILPSPPPCAEGQVWPYAINSAGQATGYVYCGSIQKAFLYDSKTGVLTYLGGSSSGGISINKFGQITGFDGQSAFLYSNSVITDLNIPFCDNPNSCSAMGYGINDLGQIVGHVGHHGFFYDGTTTHDLGQYIDPTIGNIYGTTTGTGINNYGEIIGTASTFAGSGGLGLPLLYSSKNEFVDLNTLVPTGGLRINDAAAINDRGQITGATRPIVPVGDLIRHIYLMTPIYRAYVQQPINPDGSSIFKAYRGVVPVKFTLTHSDAPTCTLLAATIAVTRTAGGTLGSIDESSYSMQADNGSNFRIDGCQYGYNLAASLLGVGTYRVDISINGITVGHAVFALK